MDPTRSRPHKGLLAGLLLLTYAYFYQAGDWGANVRFDLVRAIVERHTLVIDAYKDNTLDRSFYGGHYYLDKAPGPSLIAVPFVAATRAALGVVGVDPGSERGIVAQSYVATVVASSIPSVIGVLAVLLIAGALGASTGAALFAAVVYGVGSPTFAYATLLWGHPLAMASLAVGFAAALALRTPTTRRRGWWLGVLTGAAAGLAVLGEFTSAPPAAVLAVLATVHAWRDPDRRTILAGLGVGAGITAAIMAAYNAATFGSPFRIGYQAIYATQFSDVEKGLFGVQVPSGLVLLKLLIGLDRGLLTIVPVFAVAPLGLYLLVRAPATRAAGIAASVIATYYLLLNAGYVYWDGGGCYGPRHLAPAITFLAIGLPPVWDRAGRTVRAFMLVLAAIGVVTAFAVVATNAVPEDRGLGPLASAGTDLVHGRLSWNFYSFGVEPENDILPRRPGVLALLDRDAWNLGEAFGLRGLPTLLPLLACWALAAVAWHRQRKLG